jgi:ParB family chromosome partitioning protein
MKLAFVPLDKLSVSPLNMRDGRKAPDVSDLVPTIRMRGILQSLIVRPAADPDQYEIVAGRRRFYAAQQVATETGFAVDVPVAILDAGDDADALEASLIENIARLDADEVSQWEMFTRLVKAGKSPEAIGLTFGLPEQAVRQVLALGNLLPRVRQLYRDGDLDRVSVRYLTLASKRQQREWLGLYDDPDQWAPTGPHLKQWLFGGQSISVLNALFCNRAAGLDTVSDLFGEDVYFCDPAKFWEHQNAAIAEKVDAYRADGWGEVVVVPPTEPFHDWQFEKRAKRKGGRVYIDVRAHGEVSFHEGYVRRDEAAREAEAGVSKEASKPVRGEVSGPLATYIDLHRHAAARAKLLDHPQTALRLMVAHIVAGSPLVSVRPDPQRTSHDATGQSLYGAWAEALFAERRAQALATLGLDPEEPHLLGHSRLPHGVTGLFLTLLDVTDADVLAILAVAMGECLMVGSTPVDAVGLTIGVDMAHYWEADEAFLDLNRDKQVLVELVGEVAGATVASANKDETAKALKAILRDHVEGKDGRPKVEHWVPRWMAFPPSAYTQRGGVPTVARNAAVAEAKAAAAEPDAGQAARGADGEGQAQAAVPVAPGADRLPPEAAADPVPPEADALDPTDLPLAA